MSAAQLKFPASGCGVAVLVIPPSASLFLLIVILDGRLQTNTVKTTSGAEKKIVEIDVNSFEVVNGQNFTQTPQQDSTEESNKFESIDELDDINSDDLIGEDEIPF